MTPEEFIQIQVARGVPPDVAVDQALVLQFLAAAEARGVVPLNIVLILSAFVGEWRAPERSPAGGPGCLPS